jgi:hypothetical protein
MSVEKDALRSSDSVADLSSKNTISKEVKTDSDVKMEVIDNPPAQANTDIKPVDATVGNSTIISDEKSVDIEETPQVKIEQKVELNYGEAESKSEEPVPVPVPVEIIDTTSVTTVTATAVVSPAKAPEVANTSSSNTPKGEGKSISKGRGRPKGRSNSTVSTPVSASASKNTFIISDKTSGVHPTVCTSTVPNTVDTNSNVKVEVEGSTDVVVKSEITANVTTIVSEEKVIKVKKEYIPEFDPLDPVFKDDTEDIDDILENAHFDTRQNFLQLCQGNHYQFDQLRRAKHTSMMVRIIISFTIVYLMIFFINNIYLFSLYLIGIISFTQPRCT